MTALWKDKTWKYVPSSAHASAEGFRRRQQQRRREAQAVAAEVKREQEEKVKQIRKASGVWTG